MASPIFELVANDDVTFYAHKGILSHHSEPFKEATSGTWKESHERRILLSDWDGTTVGHLVQFLYTGDYNFGDPPTGDERQKPVMPAEPTPQPSRSGTLTPFPECVGVSLLEQPSSLMTDSGWLERVDTASFDFKELFLEHAKVYALAQFKSIAPLKALAHSRLSRILLKLHPLGPNPHLATNLVSLATYVYANTDSLSSSEEPLRRIVSQYVALNFETWQAEPAAVRMMCAGGDFVVDVLGKVCRRLREGVDGKGLASPGTSSVNPLMPTYDAVGYLRPES